jgi:hypothetical protein
MQQKKPPKNQNPCVHSLTICKECHRKAVILKEKRRKWVHCFYCDADFPLNGHKESIHLYLKSIAKHLFGEETVERYKYTNDELTSLICRQISFLQVNLQAVAGALKRREITEKRQKPLL